MYRVYMEKQCGCFKKSGVAAEQTFESKDAALSEALQLCEEMNESFCRKHDFSVVEEGDNIMIRVGMNG